MDTLDKVQCIHGQSLLRQASLDNDHRLSGHCSWTQWTVWTLSMDSLSPCPGSPGRLDNVHGQSPLSPWTDWTLSMDSLDFVLSDLVKKNEIKVASLGIYIHIF